MALPHEPLSERAIRAALVDVPLVKKVVYLPAVGSTNDAARERAMQGAPHATLVVTDDQKAGRGRMGRSWQMVPHAALAMSILVRPDLAARHASRLTMLAGLAAAEGIERATGLAIRLKWPNDVVAQIGQREDSQTSGFKKIGGILTETSIAGDHIDYAVIGIGLNVNVDFAGEPDLAETAVSIKALAGRGVNRLSVLAAVITRFAQRFEWLSADDALRAAWSARLVTLNRRVEARVGDVTLVGLAQAVDDDGALLLRADDGTLHRLQAADVSLRG